MISNRALWKTSVYIAIGGMTSVMIMRSILKDRVRKTEYYREAFKKLRAHEGAQFLLGEPIKEAGFDIGKPNYADAKEAYFEIGVKGPKNIGKMYFWAVSENEKWTIDRLELELRNDDKRLAIVKKAHDAEVVKNE
ncbi:hypothetical protein PVAND_003437 [Polypedilum vanderplanki]|uniref:Cytochrome oxidase complex assembly protein 1 n=1 Tax=Polypedilum vanderplanki TaxID=319348 RepID=A0A9J6BV28_POLVA|nr:hypothetical protein PVAND_003437 [Polypedilum vanderplanki]